MTTRPQFLAPYSANHNRVRKVRGSASNHACAMGCGSPAKDWAQVHGEDGTDPASYQPLCRRCHYRYDQESHAAGFVKRSQDPAWQASRSAMRRDQHGRYASV